jgi:uncharacterized protein
MTDFHGRFCWYELTTPERDEAAAFYGRVVGWDTRAAPVSAVTYTLFTAATKPVAGLMELTEACRQQGAKPAWIGYVAVDNVDATTALAASLGGTIRLPAMDVADVGRFSIISDPQGATIGLFKPVPQRGHPAEMGMAGGIDWHELQATDWSTVFDFYNRLFGWRKAETMGEEGCVYQLFAAGDTTIGGMFNRPQASARPFWLFYINVEDIDAATQRAIDGGGAIMTGPTAVPGGGWIIQAQDPQGVAFALHGKRAAG